MAISMSFCEGWKSATQNPFPLEKLQSKDTKDWQFQANGYFSMGTTLTALVIDVYIYASSTIWWYRMFFVWGSFCETKNSQKHRCIYAIIRHQVSKASPLLWPESLHWSRSDLASMKLDEDKWKAHCILSEKFILPIYWYTLSQCHLCRFSYYHFQDKMMTSWWFFQRFFFPVQSLSSSWVHGQQSRCADHIQEEEKTQIVIYLQRWKQLDNLEHKAVICGDVVWMNMGHVWKRKEGQKSRCKKWSQSTNSNTAWWKYMKSFKGCRTLPLPKCQSEKQLELKHPAWSAPVRFRSEETCHNSKDNEQLSLSACLAPARENYLRHQSVGSEVKIARLSPKANGNTALKPFENSNSHSTRTFHLPKNNQTTAKGHFSCSLNQRPTSTKWIYILSFLTKPTVPPGEKRYLTGEHSDTSIWRVLKGGENVQPTWGFDDELRHLWYFHVWQWYMDVSKN